MTKELKPWNVVRRRSIYAAPPHIALFADDIALPDGNTVEDYYRIESRPSCAVVASDREGRFIMIRQYKHGAGRVCLTFPGGRLEAGETIIETARRELLEETGCCADHWRALGDFPIHANQHVGVVSIFRAWNAVDTAEPSAGDLEEMEIIRVTPAEARAALSTGEIALLGDAAALSLAAFHETGD